MIKFKHGDEHSRKGKEKTSKGFIKGTDINLIFAEAEYEHQFPIWL